MRARRKWWLIGFLVAATLSWIPFGLGYACYHNGFHWRAFQDDCNHCYCSSVVGADCTLMLCDRLPAREPPCKQVVDKLTGKSSCQPCRLRDERAYDETGADPGVDVCCEGLRVFSPPLDGKPGAGVPICSACRPTGVSCNSNDDCCNGEEDRCDNFMCTTDSGWRLGP